MFSCRTDFLLAFITSLIGVIASYIFEYGFGYPVCILCLYQRFLYIAASMYSFIFLYRARPFVLFFIVIFCINGSFALYQSLLIVGVISPSGSFCSLDSDCAYNLDLIFGFPIPLINFIYCLCVVFIWSFLYIKVKKIKGN